MHTNCNCSASFLGLFDNTNAGSPSEGSKWFIIIGLMLLGCLIGSIALWCYQRTLPLEEKGSDQKSENGWEFFKIIGMGLGAVTLVPVFLQMISSSLLEKAQTNMESKFILLGFCVAATTASRRFLSVIPQKLLDAVEKINTKTENTQQQFVAVSEAVANRTAPQLVPPPVAFQEEIKSVEVKYDWKALLLIRAFLNPKFPKSRTITGLAFDSGLTIPEALKYLGEMENNGDAQRFQGDPKHGNWWALTASGRKKCALLKAQLSQLSTVETDVE